MSTSRRGFFGALAAGAVALVTAKRLGEGRLIAPFDAEHDAAKPLPDMTLASLAFRAAYLRDFQAAWRHHHDMLVCQILAKP